MPCPHGLPTPEEFGYLLCPSCELVKLQHHYHAIASQADRSREELEDCRAILDLAGDHSASVHGGIAALVCERDRLHQTLGNLLAKAEENVCTWTAEEAGDTMFETACGQSFQFFDDGPEENSFNFCHHCGMPVKVSYNYTDDSQTDDQDGKAACRG